MASLPYLKSKGVIRMNQQSTVDWWKTEAESVFSKALEQELLVFTLFRLVERDYYLFQQHEKGDSVWFRPTGGNSEDYEPMLVSENAKIPTPQVVPAPCNFHHCEPIVLDLIEDNYLDRIKEKLTTGGVTFGNRINDKLIQLLVAAISKKYQLNPRHSFDAFAATIVDELAANGFDPDTIILPKKYRTRMLTMGVIAPDTTVAHKHYAGKTNLGLNAFWVDNITDDMILVFDSKRGFALGQPPRFRRTDSYKAFTGAVCGYVNINVVIINKDAVAAITGLEQILSSLTGDRSKIQPTKDIFVDETRLEELKAITSPLYDLKKLVRLCEELNSNFGSGNYFATAMLIRAVLDHVPPLFQVATFKEVASNYSGASKSFKKSMQNLENSSRNISDALLHVQIRRSESLPNRTQVNFSNDFDVLLAEIIRILT